MAPSLAPETTTVLAEDHASGDPSLAFIHDETSAPPTFVDKHEERKYLKHRLALAFRVFAKFGFAEGVAGHITVRDPVDPTSFWVNPFGMHFSLIRDEDLIRVDHAGRVVDGGKNRRLNYGVVLASEEGKHISKALGHKKAALLGNHGLLTAGPSIEATVAWFVLLDKCCEVQLAADASAAGSGEPLIRIGEAESQSTWEALGHGSGGYFMGLPLFQVAEQDFGEMSFLGRGLEPL
ncbi:hypothetical protein B7463_g10077, partial [Scytalidium lignicola]